MWKTVPPAGGVERPIDRDRSSLRENKATTTSICCVRSRQLVARKHVSYAGDSFVLIKDELLTEHNQSSLPGGHRASSKRRGWRKIMSENAVPAFHAIEASGRLHAGRSKRSEAEALPRPGPSPCWSWALLLSIPLWSAIWAIISAIISAWPSWTSHW